MKYKLLIFDLDNTVLDYNKAENFALTKTFEFFNSSATEELKDSYRVINEQTWQRFERGEITSEELRVIRFQQFSSVHNLGWDAAEVSRVYLKNLGLGGFLTDEADPLLFELSSDFRLASVTNGISEVQRSRLSNTPFNNFFDPLVISDEVGIAKPDPGIFDVLVERAGIKDRGSVLMIGDSLSSDIAGAAAADIDTCWFNPESASNKSDIKPKYIIENLSDIKEIVYG